MSGELARINIYLQEAEAIKASAEALVVETEADRNMAVEFLGNVASLKKAIDEQRKKLVDPLNHEVKRINDSFKEVTLPVLEADRIARDKVSVFNIRKQQEALKAQRKAIEEAAKATIATGEVVPVIMPPEPEKVVRTGSGTAYTRMVWDFKVVDESQVPAQYKIVDERKIRAAVASGLREIPGVQIFQRADLTVTGRR